MATMFKGFFQLGFVARDLEGATAMLSRRYGVERFRRRRATEWMESAHAWIGDVMIEVIAIGTGAPALYGDCLADDPAARRLHHHGFRVADADAWAAIERRVAEDGLATPMKGTVMDGQLNYMYVDTRADLGIYSEFIHLTGAATTLYDDVPRN